MAHYTATSAETLEARMRAPVRPDAARRNSPRLVTYLEWQRSTPSVIELRTSNFESSGTVTYHLFDLRPASS
jgi:hypothetical protein